MKNISGEPEFSNLSIGIGWWMKQRISGAKKKSTGENIIAENEIRQERGNDGYKRTVLKHLFLHSGLAVHTCKRR